MKSVSVIFGLLAAIVVGAVALFTVGEVVAILAFVVLLGLGIYGAAAAPPGVLRGIAFGSLVLFVLGGAFIAFQAVQIVSAFGDTDGPADPADPITLAAAQAKIDEASDDGGFRIELEESEIQAVIQDALSDDESPLARVTIDIVDGEGGERGTLEFVGEFKSGNLDVEGVATATLETGAVRVELVSVDLGALSVPGLAEGAIEDLVESVADLNETLERKQADVQSVALANDRVVITGTQGTGDLLTAGTLLDGLAQQAADVAGAVEPPPERLGPGVVNATSASGSVNYVALGDSLAANVGVDQPRDGYVSRLHNQLQTADGREYGLQNFGISGETTGTLIRSGQLDDAVAFMEDNEVAYVSIDIGANDLLGHIGSGDCADSLDAPACRERIDATFASYEENLNVIFDALEDAAPDATIVFMRAYNPFSLGFGASVGLEAQSNEILDEFNDVAAGIASERGIAVADAYTPMQNTAAATTHMLDSPPDIHPVPIGYDILASAIVDALGL